jgi:benzodiazapine receptor
VKRIDFKKLIFSIALCQGAGLLGSAFTAPAITSWYALLNKPSFAPPNSLFAPVWVVLYTLMGISLYLVWQKGVEKGQVKDAMILFGIHLLVNASWSIIFFGLKNVTWALLEISFLLGVIIAVITKFYKINKTAGLLLVPYLLWVAFATVLNYSIWLLN